VTTESKISKVQELVYEIRVGDVMKKNVITVGPQSMMSELGKILREKRISGTPVVDQGKLMGIISIDDFVRWLAEKEQDCPVAGRMTEDVRTLYADEPVVQAVNRFDQLGYGRFAVVDRRDEKLLGIITKGDIVEGLLKKLEIDYYNEQTSHRTIQRFFDDVLADKAALFFQYSVTGHDFNKAGETASRIKTTLKRLGIAPQIVRRVAIATYEAEMNLIIYTEGALQPGYSTAPEWVRELGFGAGMGLQNIRKCASKMGLRSTVGKGTWLRINIAIDDGAASEAN